MSREPTRLADLGGEASPSQDFMRDVIRAERTELPSDAKMRELATRLGPIVTPSGTKAASSAWKWLVIAALAGTFTVSALALRSTSNTTSNTPSSAPAKPAATVADEVAAKPAAAPEPPAPGISVDSLPSVDAPPRAKPASVAAGPVCTGELELVDRADAALRAGDATGALAIVREHGERCANGSFVQERERIAIEALARLGRRDEVRERARAFEARFPSSPHLRRVRSLVEKDAR